MSGAIPVSSILESPYVSEFRAGKTQPRTPFAIKKDAKPAEEAEILFETALIYGNLFETGKLNKVQFGQAMIHNYSRFLSEIGVGSSRFLTEGQKEEIENADYFYRDILKEDFETSKRGATREFASMVSAKVALSKLGLKDKFGVVRSRPDEDLYLGTDFLIQNKQTRSLYGIQVKSFPMARKMDHLLLPFKNDVELEGQVNHIISNSTFGGQNLNQNATHLRRPRD